MRLPDTVSVARRWVLAGGAVALLLLLVLVVLQVRMRPPVDEHRSGPEAPVAAASPFAPGPTPLLSRHPATGVPEAIRIPAVGIDARVDPVRLGPAGLLVPPSDPSRVGWWSGGAKPGSLRGAVVLVGHSVRLGDGVFDRLPDLEPGDRVRVGTARGEVGYRVLEVLNVSKEDLVGLSERLFSQSGAGRLVLVTCADWESGRYHANTVVVARR